jgi:hypothetical protein
MERTMTGNFRGIDLGAGAWRLTTGIPGGSEVYLGGTDSAAASVLAAASPSVVTVSWGAHGALVTLKGADAIRTVKAKTAILHEPLARLYEGLPLVSLDDRARRFWRRVFWLVRLPGGRRLVRLIARGSAKKPRTKA